MKLINELKAERAELIAKMEAISNSENLTDEQRSEWTGFDDQIKKIDGDITLAERQEELNKTNVRKMENNTPTEERVPAGIAFRDWLYEAVKDGGKAPSFRADPILTSTDAGLINKQIYPGIDILVSPGEAFLRKLGATFFTGLTGNLVVNSMAQDLATFPGENTGAASANMAPAALTLAARRVSHSQAISKETLAQSIPAIYASILQNLVNGVWNAVVADYFTTIRTDGVAPIAASAGATVGFADIVNLEAAIAQLNIGPAAYCTTPALRADLKRTAYLTNQQPIWLNDQMNGYPAYCSPGCQATYIYFGDFSRHAVAQWGGLEVVVDPYVDAKKGLINLTMIALFDTGCMNVRGLSIVPIA